MAQSKLLVAAGGLAAILFLGGPAFAQHAGRHDVDDKVPPGQAGQTAGVDAQGRLRPLTNEEVQELIAGIGRWVDQSTDGLSLSYHPTGAISLFLDDRFQSVSLARIGTDGAVATQCVGNIAEAKHFLGQDARAPAKRATPAVALEEK